MAVFRPGAFVITDRALEITGLPAGSRIIDIGCGEGDTAGHLKGLGMEVRGIDPDQSRIDRARQRYSDCEFFCAKAEQLTAPEGGGYDLVMAECVMSLVDSPAEVMDKIYSVLKPGGWMIITDLYDKMEGNELRYGGAFHTGPLKKCVGAAGFGDLQLEDFSLELDNYVIELVLNGQQPDCFCNDLRMTAEDGSRRKIGYFLLAARKI